MRRRREQPRPEPHPDPQTEAQLEQIRALQRRATRMEAEIAGHHEEIASLHHQIRENRGRQALGYRQAGEAARAQEARVSALLARIDDVEDRIGGVHDEIAKRQAVLSPSDLAYL